MENIKFYNSIIKLSNTSLALFSETLFKRLDKDEEIEYIKKRKKNG